MKKTEVKKHASALVIFGATGDLTQNKIYPSLYELARRDLLPRKFYLFGLAQEALTKKQFQHHIRASIKKLVKNADETAIKKLLKCVEYISADLTENDSYHKLEARIREQEAKIGHGILRLFYLALPPALFSEVIGRIETCKMGKSLCSREEVLSRVIVEKPFGSDYASALKLDRMLRRVFNERQIYRIDHYLGKEAFQNIFSFRFANDLFDEVWNRKHIEFIQINALETVGLEERHAYYDGAGALRDMVQSHLFQLMAYVLMDEPKNESVRALHASKERLLAAVRPLKGKNLIAGQYRGYKKEKGIPRDSKTETYAAIACEVVNSRWKGVPIYIRTGKKLDRKETSVVIQFKKRIPKSFGVTEKEHEPNRLFIELAPNPSIELDIHVSKPGFQTALDLASMHYCRTEHETLPPVGDYERLLMDVIVGNQALFTSSREVLNAWKALEPFQKAKPHVKLHGYKSSTEGPSAAKQILRGKQDWLRPTNTCPMHK